MSNLAKNVLIWDDRAMSSAPRKPGPLTDAIVGLLNERITREGWTQAAVSEASGVPESTLSQTLKGDRNGNKKPVDLEQLDRLAWSIGYPLEKLVKDAEKLVANRQASKTWPAKRLTSPS